MHKMCQTGVGTVREDIVLILNTEVFIFAYGEKI